MLSTVVIFIVVLGVLVFVHELGHFLVAKASGVSVLKFSLGFGPKIIGKKVGETEYLISALPLGGYVKMLGEGPDEEITEEEQAKSFSNKPPLTKMAIVCAGPAFNILFTALVYTFVFMYGMEVLSSVVGYVAKDSPAYHSGIRSGDKIIRIDDESITEWGNIEDYVSKKVDEKISVTILRDGREMVVEATPEKQDSFNIFQEPIEIGSIGIWPFISTIVGQVNKDSPAEAGGLKSGDKIVVIEGIEVGQWSKTVEIIRESAGKELAFIVERGNETLNLKITPGEYKDTLSTGEEITIGRIGISSGKPHNRSIFLKRYNPFAAFIKGWGQTWELTKLIGISMKKLISGEVSSKNIAGPIGIAQMTGQVARQGFISLLSFMAFMSINLGILNLLPIPILDGGHLLFFTLEAILGKPLNEKKMEIAQKIGMTLLIALMVLAFYNDILRLLSG
ncbi:MAG: RIP metalloprotease RseP [Thermodesulfobacteriota bacterium]